MKKTENQTEYSVRQEKPNHWFFSWSSKKKKVQYKTFLYIFLMQHITSISENTASVT